MRGTWFIVLLLITASASPLIAAIKRNVASIVVTQATLGGPRLPIAHGLSTLLTEWLEPAASEPDERRRHMRRALGFLREMQGDAVGARRQWQLAGGEDVWLRLSNRAWRRQRPEEAEQFARRAVVANPRNPDTHIQLAWLYWPARGRVAEAADIYRSMAAAFMPGSFERAFAEGQVSRFAQDWPRALERFERAARLAPVRDDVWRLAAEAAAKSGRSDVAISHLRQAARQSPHDAGIYLELGDVYRAAGQLSAASAEYANALRISPGNAFFRRRLAEALEAAGRPEENVDRPRSRP